MMERLEENAIQIDDFLSILYLLRQNRKSFFGTKFIATVVATLTVGVMEGQQSLRTSKCRSKKCFEPSRDACDEKFEPL